MERPPMCYIPHALLSNLLTSFVLHRPRGAEAKWEWHDQLVVLGHFPDRLPRDLVVIVHLPLGSLVVRPHPGGHQLRVPRERGGLRKPWGQQG